MSRRTLYANFADRRSLFEAAIDSACAQVAAATVPAFRRHRVPAEGLRAAVGALLALLASRPNLAHLLLVASYEGGGPALRWRQTGLRPLGSLVRSVPSAGSQSALGGVASEGALGGILALIRRRFLDAGPAGLPALGPICTFIALAPLIGSEQATVAAEGRAYRRGSADLRGTAAQTALGIRAAQIPMALSHGEGRSVPEIAEEAGISHAEAERLVPELLEAALIVALEEKSADGQRLYRSPTPLISTRAWSELVRGRQEADSASIGRVIEVEVAEAVAAGTFDSQPERHLVRIPGRLDPQGWQEMHDKLNLTTYECLDIERRARERIEAAGPGAESISTRVYIVSFEAASPEDRP